MIDFDDYCNIMDRLDDWFGKMYRPSLTARTCEALGIDTDDIDEIRRRRWVPDSAPSTLQIDPDTVRSNVRIHVTMLPDHMAKRYRFAYGPDSDGVLEELCYTVNVDDPCTVVGTIEHTRMKQEQIDKVVERVIEKHKRIAEQKKVLDAIKKYNINPATKKEENTMPINRANRMIPTLNGGVDITDIQIYNNKVVKVVFSDGTFTKAVCGDNDHFDLDIGITICVIKKMAGKDGHKWYNNLIRKAHAVMDHNAEAKKMEQDICNKVKEHNKKEQERRKAGKEKAKQEQIDIHSEAFLKALKEWTEKQEGLKKACGPAN